MISKLQKNDTKNKGEFELVHKIIEGTVIQNNEREEYGEIKKEEGLQLQRTSQVAVGRGKEKH